MSFRLLARVARGLGRQPARVGLAGSSSRFGSSVPPSASGALPATRPPQKHRPKKGKAAQPSPLSQLAVPATPSSPSPSPSIASLLLPVGFHKSPFDLSSLDGANSPAGQAIALTTAESFDTPSLLRGLHALGLLEGNAAAVNLLGEAIYLPKWRPDKSSAYGELFIFENGSFVSWGLGKAATETFLKTVIRGGVDGHDLDWVERGRYKESEMEVLEYWVKPNGDTKMAGDAIHLAAAPSASTSTLSSSAPPSHDLLARLAFSSGMARVTKLGVYEEQFDEYANDVAGIPQLLESGSESPVEKTDIIKRVGKLHGFRQKLNLDDSGIIDEPEFLWEDSRLHGYHESVCKALEFDERLQTLNHRVDYAFQLQSTLMDLLNTKTSHRLEWIIIILIAFEISIVLIREGMALAHEGEATVEKPKALEAQA